MANHYFSRIVLVLLGAALAEAPLAIAANVKTATKKTTVGDLVGQSSRGADLGTSQKSKFAIPVVPIKDLEASPRKSIDLSQVKPPKSSDFFQNENEDQRQLEKIIDQQIDELYKLSQRYKDSHQRGELWLRLAEAYVEKAGMIDFRKQNAYDVQLKEYQSGQRKEKPQLNLSDAKEFNKKSIQLYEWFSRDFPKDQKMDQVYFFLGYNNFEIGNVQKGMEYYSKLTTTFTQSPYRIESNFALAEYNFENEKWHKAREYYNEVVKNRRHRLFIFSLYKLAWCEFRTGNTEKALKTMEILIRVGREQEVTQTESGKRINKNKLEQEALRDMILFFAEVHTADQAPAYFEKWVGKDNSSYLEKLAFYYSDKGNLKGAQLIFHHLISTNPTAAKSFEYKFQIVKMFSNAKNSTEFKQELFTWIKDFDASGAWFRANAGNKELVENSAKLRETTLRNYVLQHHQTAQNSRAPFSQGLALEGYKLYLAEFKTSPFVADMHFYLAELLYDMQKYDEASDNYRWVVENGKNSKYQTKAAENIVISLEKDLPKDEEITRRVGKTVDSIPFDPRVAKFVDTGEWFIKEFPQSEKILEIRFRIGRFHYQFNHFDQAIPIFKNIVFKFPNTKYAEYSANLLLDIYNLKQDFKGLAQTGTELLAVI